MRSLLFTVLLLAVLTGVLCASRFRRQQNQGTSTTAAPSVDSNGTPLNCTCRATPQHNPVCGTDGNTYGNTEKLACAQRCGRDVQIVFYGVCNARGR